MKPLCAKVILSREGKFITFVMERSSDSSQHRISFLVDKIEKVEIHGLHLYVNNTGISFSDLEDAQTTHHLILKEMGYAEDKETETEEK